MIFVDRGKYTVGPDDIDSMPEHENNQLVNKVQGLEDDMGHAVMISRFHHIPYLP